MSDDSYSDGRTARRPRLSEGTNDKLEKQKEKIKFMIEEAEDVSDEKRERLEDRYKGQMGKISFDKIINEGLEALQERGLAD